MEENRKAEILTWKEIPFENLKPGNVFRLWDNGRFHDSAGDTIFICMSLPYVGPDGTQTVDCKSTQEQIHVLGA